MAIIILLIALGIRLINLNQSLWWDEAINIVYARSHTLWDFITKYSMGDFHPPGYFALLWIWIKLFGSSEISARLPSVLCGAATVYLTYLIGKELFSKRAGLIASLFLSLAPLHIYYSQEARMYSFAAFAAVLATYFFIRLFRGLRFGLWGYALSLVLLLYSDYVAYLILPAHLVFVLVYQRKAFRKYLLSSALGFVAIIPWMLIFPNQLSNGQLTASILTGWRDVVGGVSVKNLALLFIKSIIGRISFENQWFYLIFIVLSAAPYMVSLSGMVKSINMQGRLLVLWLMVPVLLGLAISLFIPIFAYFRFIFILPAFYLLIGYLCSKITAKKTGILIVSLILLSEVVSSSIYLFNARYHREDWKGAAEFIEGSLDNQGVVIFENSEVPAAYKYYSRDLSSVLAGFRAIPAKTTVDFNNLERQLEDKRSIYLFDYLVDVMDPQRLLKSKLLSLGYIESQVYDFQGIGFVRRYLKMSI